MSCNIVVEWLRSLGLAHYAESFLDNGYDDLEICKQVGDPDLDAIGVVNVSHRQRLLQSIRTLREEGAASVYFTLEESAAIQEECKCESGRSSRSPSSTSSRRQPYEDEYEEGKAELVRIPKRQLKTLLKDRLQQDGIKLTNQPYSSPNGERGYLEGIGTRYAELFRTHYGDVLADLEELRQKEWAELSPRIRVLPPGSLTTSQSQPIYLPGKYSVSSCLSDREEDEIYGFAGYGVYGKQMMHRHQHNKLIMQPSNNYNNCQSPRSAYFYEFPPNGERPASTSKKKTSLSKLLRHLKTTYRRDKSSNNANRSSASTTNHANDRCGTPDAIGLEAGGSSQSSSDYDRAHLLQKTPPQNPTFEETIHRLKIEEALKKKERFDREHEEILRSIRQGLGEVERGQDDTYMYCDEAEAHEMGRLSHWYDEPPYESDPEDFLMGEPLHPRYRSKTLVWWSGS